MKLRQRVFQLSLPHERFHSDAQRSFYAGAAARALDAVVVAVPADEWKLELVGPRRFVSRLRTRQR